MTKEKLTKKQKEKERRAVSKKLAKEKTEAVAVMVKKYKMSEEEVLKVCQHFHVLHALMSSMSSRSGNTSMTRTLMET